MSVLEDWQLSMIEVLGESTPRPFRHVYQFVRNNQIMSAHDFSETKCEIADTLNRKGVNFGILMFVTGTLVFTEEPIDLNAVLFKLATDINFHGEIPNAPRILECVNNYLGR